MGCCRLQWARPAQDTGRVRPRQARRPKRLWSGRPFEATISTSDLREAIISEQTGTAIGSIVTLLAGIGVAVSHPPFTPNAWSYVVFSLAITAAVVMIWWVQRPVPDWVARR